MHVAVNNYTIFSSVVAVKSSIDPSSASSSLVSSRQQSTEFFQWLPLSLHTATPAGRCIPSSMSWSCPGGCLPKQHSQEVSLPSPWSTSPAPISVQKLEPDTAQRPIEIHTVSCRVWPITQWKKTQYSYVCPGSYSFSYCPQPVITGEG